MTTEDKIWIGSGVALALAGGVYYFIQKKNNRDKELTSDIGQEVPLENSSSIPKTATPPYVAMGHSSTPIRDAEPFRYHIGQEVMATGFNGTKTYDARLMADGNYVSEGIRKATFKKGDSIGKIIWAGTRPDGTHRYVVQRDGAFLNDIYWIADQSVIKPIGKILPIRVPKGSESINTNKLLKRGSKGAEVSVLQKLLKIRVDGDFGRNTQKALFTQKKVNQIQLKNWR